MSRALTMSAVLLLSCGGKSPPEAAAEPLSVADGVRATMDLTADPCDDFYQYACGGWLERTPLPADKPVWGRSFSSITEDNRVFIRQLLDRAAAEPDTGGDDWRKMGDIYRACLDEGAIDAQGLAPLQPWRDQIAGISDAESLAAALGALERVGVSALAGVWVDGDFTDPELAILHLSQTGLGLPDRDYYLKDDEKSLQLLADYEAYLAATLAAVGADAGLASGVLGLETELAELHWASERLRDPETTYHKIDRDGLIALSEDFPWATWLDAVEAGGVTDINVSTPEPIQKQAALLLGALQDRPEVLRAWLQARLIMSTSAHLPAAFADASFDFFSKKVYGQQQQEPRWKRCVDTTNRTVGDIVSRYYVEARFPGDSKEKAQELIVSIQGAFEAGLPELSWMDDATRAAAAEKASLLQNKIGYPDEWRDYSALSVGSDTHLENILSSRRFGHSFWMAQAGEPVDRGIWFMAASQVNAYYHPTRAEMVFPAGILQPPFFSRDFPMAMNFGGIGMIMGHELTHGFDDSGRKFDGRGRMVEWWPEGVSEAFEERAQCVEDFYSGYEVSDGLFVNGALTLGENIADIGGTKEAFSAYQAWVDDNGPEPQLMDELSNEQLFFVSMAQGWCTVMSPEFEKVMVLSNPHSPARFRVLGPASNLPEFHETFQCEPGDAMRPEQSCEVW
jgi:putative endopeptidase